MKKILLIYRLILLSLPCLYLTSCIHEYPDDNVPRPFTLLWTSEHPDELNGIRLWIFDQNEVLLSEQLFSNLEAARSATIALPTVPYTFVAATCPSSHYTCETAPGVTRLRDLLITVNEMGSNPPHIQSAVTTVAPASQQVEINMSRILSELTFSLKNLPPDVVMVRADILNSPDGYFPGTAALTNRYSNICIGELAPDEQGTVQYPLIRILPVSSQPILRNQNEPTKMLLTLTKNNGEEMTFNAVAPSLQSGHQYDLEVNYDNFQVGVVVVATVKNWDPGNDEGENGEVH